MSTRSKVLKLYMNIEIQTSEVTEKHQVQCTNIHFILQTSAGVYKYVKVSLPSSGAELFLQHLHFISPSVSRSSGYSWLLECKQDKFIRVTLKLYYRVGVGVCVFGATRFTGKVSSKKKKK